MSLDGKLLAKARERLEEIKAENAAEQERRQARIYAEIPRIKAIDLQLQRLFAQVVGVTLKQHTDPQAALKEIDEKSMALRAEKAELLVSAGRPADYLEDIYSCRVCHDSGFTRAGQPCSCLMELYRGEQAKELSSLLKLGEDDFSRFDLSYYGTELDPRYGVSPREAMELVLSTCRHYAVTFGPGSQNLLLRGGTGLGKTFLSACIAKTVAGQGFSVVYDTAVSAFEAFEVSKFSRDSAEGAAGAEKCGRILACDLMILDDLGTEMTTSFTQSALYTIVNTRLTEGRKTIISTNLTAEEMASRYTGQIVSRIDGEYDTLLFLGRDIRAQKKERRYL